LKPFPISAQTPTNLQNDFSIDWKNLIIHQYVIQAEYEIEYLKQIAKYSNNCIAPYGINAQVFDYQLDTEFERLLAMVHQIPIVAQDFIAELFCQTNIADYLSEFATENQLLKNLIYQADFQYLNAFEIQGELSKNLYYYGMYRFFWQDFSPNEAQTISLQLMDLIFENDLENVICFTTRLPWGKWFDIHSCTDYTFVFLNKKARKIWLFCFSHSD
jgi:hypothetical protein